MLLVVDCGAPRAHKSARGEPVRFDFVVKCCVLASSHYDADFLLPAVAVGIRRIFYITIKNINSS
jgi:hypothetical protein